MLILKDIIKNYEVPVLGPIDLEIKSKSFVSIIGASGSGKSTFLRLASGLISQSSGSISYKNNIKPKMGFVFQDSTLLPWRNVIDNVLLPSELTKQNNSESIEKSINWLERVGLKGKENSFPNELSGGQKMRVSIARAMVQGGDLLLLDEPFSALDEVTRRKLEDDLLEIWETNNITVLFVTHSVTQAVYLSQRVIVLSSGPGIILEDLAIEKNLKDDFEETSEFISQVRHLTNILKKRGA
jgi:NitT/TauT family transport system ATP-binding protein